MCQIAWRMNIVRNVPILAPLSGYDQKKIVDVRETCFFSILTFLSEAQLIRDRRYLLR
jgi:sulfite reductase beta subunit-like hemoprotein